MHISLGKSMYMPALVMRTSMALSSAAKEAADVPCQATSSDSDFFRRFQKRELTPVGFEPTHPKIPRPERGALDQLGQSVCAYCNCVNARRRMTFEARYAYVTRFARASDGGLTAVTIHHRPLYS